jgi:hypothetical protein
MSRLASILGTWFQIALHFCIRRTTLGTFDRRRRRDRREVGSADAIPFLRKQKVGKLLAKTDAGQPHPWCSAKSAVEYLPRCQQPPCKPATVQASALHQWTPRVNRPQLTVAVLAACRFLGDRLGPLRRPLDVTRPAVRQRPVSFVHGYANQPSRLISISFLHIMSKFCSVLPSRNDPGLRFTFTQQSTTLLLNYYHR